MQARLLNPRVAVSCAGLAVPERAQGGPGFVTALRDGGSTYGEAIGVGVVLAFSLEDAGEGPRGPSVDDH
jgi:hypothetical protein